MTSEEKWIEVNKITTTNNQVGIKKGTIPIDDIKSYRAWHKSEADKTYTSSEMTVLTIKSPTDDKPYEIKIAEGEGAFADRLGKRVIRLNDDNNTKQGNT